MPIANRLRKTSTVTGAGTGTAGIRVDPVTLALKWNPDGTERAVSGNTGAASVETVSAANTILASENGKTFFLNSGTEFLSILPPVAAGLKFTFIVDAAPSGADYTIEPSEGTDIIFGNVVSSDLNAGTDADFTAGTGVDLVSFVSAKAVKGDRVDFVSNGTAWFATAYCSLFDAITFS